MCTVADELRKSKPKKLPSTMTEKITIDKGELLLYNVSILFNVL